MAYRDRRDLAYAAALLAVLGWGSLYPAAKPALREVTPLMIAFARAGIACLVLGALSCIQAGGLRRGAAHLRREASAGGRDLVALGLISFSGTSLLAMTAQQFLPASVNGLLNNLSPLWLAVYATAAGRARNGLLLLTGSGLAVLGVAAVLLGDVQQPAGSALQVAPPASRAGTGVVLSLAGSLLIAVANLVTRRVTSGRDPLAVTALAAAWGALPLLVALALGWGGSLPAYAGISPGTAGLLVWLGTASTAFNFSLWFFALAHLPVTRVANFQYLIPPLGVALAVLLLKEPAGPGLIAGTVAIAGGIALAQRGAEPAQNQRVAPPPVSAPTACAR